MCGHHSFHAWHGHEHGHCCHGPEPWDPCCRGPEPRGPGFRFYRRFPTRQERIAWLEEYLKELQAEVQAVQEHLAELKARG